MTSEKRTELAAIIRSVAIDWAVGYSEVEVIDRLNIHWATIRAMHQAVEKLKYRPDFLVIDGKHYWKSSPIPYRCEIKGDSRFLHVAAASVLAKTTRDELMNNLAAQFPEYGWETNKGYPTPPHRRVLRAVGMSVHHRRTFDCLGNAKKNTKPTDKKAGINREAEPTLW
jgi:ribonuclease HII